jgi:hypothetical protein
VNKKEQTFYCEVCGKPYKRNLSDIKRYKHNFCSWGCRCAFARSYKNTLRNRVEVHCEQCGKVFTRVLSQVKRNIHHFCSLQCRNEWRCGSNSGTWKGGIDHRGKGYIAVKVPKDDFFYPMADHHGYVLEHRLIMAKYMHRCLLPWEVVHHKNGMKNDNRIGNLEVLPSRTKHYSLEKLVKMIKKLENKVEKLEKENRLLKWHIKELSKNEQRTL